MEQKYKQLSAEIKQSEIAAERWNVVQLMKMHIDATYGHISDVNFHEHYQQIRLGRNVVRLASYVTTSIATIVARAQTKNIKHVIPRKRGTARVVYVSQLTRLLSGIPHFFPAVGFLAEFFADI